MRDEADKAHEWEAAMLGIANHSKESDGGTTAPSETIPGSRRQRLAGRCELPGDEVVAGLASSPSDSSGASAGPSTLAVTLLSTDAASRRGEPDSTLPPEVGAPMTDESSSALADRLAALEDEVDSLKKLNEMLVWANKTVHANYEDQVQRANDAEARLAATKDIKNGR